MKKSYRVKLKTGKIELAKSHPLLLGEIVYAIDTKELIVGDPDSEKGYQVVSTVISNEEGRLYAQIDNKTDLIPIFIYIK